MSFAPPDSSERPSAAPTTPIPRTPPTPSASSADDRKAPWSGVALPPLSPAGWLATTGASMLLLAAVVVVAGRWESISAEIRFAGLVASLLAVTFTAEALRHRVRLTATALATLAAALTAPVGIAASATLHQEWPVCVLVGGLAACCATEVQSRRWNVSTLKAATAVAAGLASTGLAALSGVPVALFGACAAALFFVFGASKRSIVLSAAVGCAPALLAVAEAGIAPGTLERIGATGPSIAWTTPLSATIAAGVIAMNAQRRRDVRLVALAAATLATGWLVGAESAEVSTIIWWCVPGAVLLLIEAVSTLGRGSIWSVAADAARPVVVIPLAIAATLTPLAAALAWLVDDGGNGWTIPIVVTAAALWATTAGNYRTTAVDHSFTWTFLAASSASVAAAMSVQPGVFGWTEIGTLTVIAALMAAVSTTRSAVWAHSASILFVVTGSLSCVLLEFTATQASLGMIIIATVLAGIGFVRPLFNPIDTAALTTGCVAVVIAFNATPALLSIALATLSALGILYGLAAVCKELAAPAALSFIASLVSLWWTSGTNVAVIAAIAPYRADGGDLALSVASSVLIGIGALIRRSQHVSSWLAYSPGLGMAAAWLLAAQLDHAAIWATLLALTIGVTATAVGGLHRLGAPLLIGTGLIASTVIISAGSRLAAAPTWLWIAAGGLGLLVIAAAIERLDRPLIVGDDSKRSVLQQFSHDFD